MGNEDGSFDVLSALGKTGALLLVLQLALTFCRGGGAPLIQATQSIGPGIPHRALVGEQICPDDPRTYRGTPGEGIVSFDTGDGTGNINHAFLQGGLLSCKKGDLLVTTLTPKVVGGNYYDHTGRVGQEAGDIISGSN